MNTVKPFDPMGSANVELGSNKLNRIVHENNANQIIPGGSGIRMSRTGTGVTISAIKRRYPTQITVCAFGQIVTANTNPPTKAIRGGLITCGDKNFNVADYSLDLSSNGNKVAYITIPCEVNMDDDSELLLPGIKTSSATSIASEQWTISGNYPSNTNPTVTSSGIGIFIFPVASFTVTDGAVSNFVPTGCGKCAVTHCAGTLSHNRG